MWGFLWTDGRGEAEGAEGYSTKSAWAEEFAEPEVYTIERCALSPPPPSTLSFALRPSQFGNAANDSFPNVSPS